jgi:hypothetical protein
MRLLNLVKEQPGLSNAELCEVFMHHDRLPHVSEAWPWLTQARILMRRLFVI